MSCVGLPPSTRSRLLFSKWNQTIIKAVPMMAMQLKPRLSPKPRCQVGAEGVGKMNGEVRLVIDQVRTYNFYGWGELTLPNWRNY